MFSLFVSSSIFLRWNFFLLEWRKDNQFLPLSTLIILLSHVIFILKSLRLSFILINISFWEMIFIDTAVSMWCISLLISLEIFLHGNQIQVSLSDTHWMGVHRERQRLVNINVHQQSPLGPWGCFLYQRNVFHTWYCDRESLWRHTWFHDDVYYYQRDIYWDCFFFEIHTFIDCMICIHADVSFMNICFIFSVFWYWHWYRDRFSYQ